mmetsp:Transcript_26090/g.62019  ORF Transcript_26090/g.62019 Transcript_26090/m.62019 type:complete len:148 (-) Transcript_26090:295-738(-)
MVAASNDIISVVVPDLVPTVMVMALDWPLQSDTRHAIALSDIHVLDSHAVDPTDDLALISPAPNAAARIRTAVPFDITGMLDEVRFASTQVSWSYELASDKLPPICPTVRPIPMLPNIPRAALHVTDDIDVHSLASAAVDPTRPLPL